MSSSEGAPDFETYVSDRLSEQADDLTGEWVETLSETLGVRPSRLLPTEALKDHIPNVIRGVADFLVVPVQPVKSDMVGRLRLLAELRREQGYDIEELLVEFETLSDGLYDHFTDLVEEYPGEVDPVDVARVAGRIRKALMKITHVTVGTYRTEESEQKRELARRLAEYTRTISHELKNPLNAANMSAQMLQEGGLPEEKQERFIDQVVKSLGQVDDLVDDIRVLAIEEGAQSEARWIPLREAVEAVFEVVRDRAKKKGIELETRGELPSIKVDAARVEIALINLVVNSIKYADPDKDERWVKVGVEPVETGERTEGGWVVSVADNGLGIPKALQNKVFQRHFRAHPEAAEGTGLGLSITHYLVTQRGGSIDFESTEGEGTTFYVTIPERQERPDKEEGKRRP